MRVKILGLFLFIICLVLSAAIVLKVTYDNVYGESVPVVSIQIFGVEARPVQFDWHVAVFRGLMHKPFSAEDQKAALDVGELEDAEGARAASITIPEGFGAVYELFMDGEFVSSGNMRQWREKLYEEPGDYKLLIFLEKPKESFEGYGSFAFCVHFTIPVPEPEFFAGRLSLTQGEIFVLKLTNVSPDVTPAAKTELGLSIFTPRGAGEWFAAIPVGNTRRPGNYKVNVNAGKFEWEVSVSVAAYDFSTQNLIIDTTNPVITEANSPAAYQQYREKIPPLFDTYDEQIYWEDTFIRPVSGGRITTQFGAIRYTNSNWSNPRHHWGVDIAADTGTPVAAPNHGRVVLAEYLLNTGFTIAIEHGGGLKSYYYHMDSINVSAGDMVQKGARIGAVGSTGYSTGPHLHFEMRIGNQAVNPMILFDGSASLYHVYTVE